METARPAAMPRGRLSTKCRCWLGKDCYCTAAGTTTGGRQKERSLLEAGNLLSMASRFLHLYGPVGRQRCDPPFSVLTFFNISTASATTTSLRAEATSILRCHTGPLLITCFYSAGVRKPGRHPGGTSGQPAVLLLFCRLPVSARVRANRAMEQILWGVLLAPQAGNAYLTGS